MLPSPHGPVLVPVDFSPHSEAALAWAGEYARRFDVPMVVLHVVHDPVENPGYYLKEEGKVEDGGNLALQPIEDVAAKRMKAFLQEATARHPDLGGEERLEVRLVAGVPATRILEVAGAVGARLVVMGSEGKRGLGHLIEGSSAEHVARLSPVPVTIVKAQTEKAGEGKE